MQKGKGWVRDIVQVMVHIMYISGNSILLVFATVKSSQAHTGSMRSRRQAVWSSYLPEGITWTCGFSRTYNLLPDPLQLKWETPSLTHLFFIPILWHTSCFTKKTRLQTFKAWEHVSEVELRNFSLFQHSSEDILQFLLLVLFRLGCDICIHSKNTLWGSWFLHH